MQDFLNAIALLPRELETLLCSVNNDLASEINEIRFIYVQLFQ